MRPIAVLTVAIFAVSAAAAAAEDLPYPESEVIFEGFETVAGETVDFPRERDAVEAMVVTLAPGAATRWHRHGTPLFVYLMEGEVEVTYEAMGVRTYSAGDAFLEAMDEAHIARNRTEDPVRILAVYMAGDGNALAIPVDPPQE